MLDYIADATYQGLAYYTMSSLTNGELLHRDGAAIHADKSDPFKLARMAGYYKGVQSAGAAVSFGMDAVKVCAYRSSSLTQPESQTAYLTEHLVSWLMLVISLPLCGYVLWGIRDTNYDIEGVIHAEEVDKAQMHGSVAMPTGHHLHDDPTSYGARVEQGEEKKDQDIYTRHV